MIRHLAVFMLVLSASSVQADDVVRVLAGDHGSFIRIVLTGRSGNYQWQVMQTNARVEIDAGISDASYDLHALFDRIPRDTLRSAEDLGNGKLRLDLSCACEVASVPWQDAGLYLDISTVTVAAAPPPEPVQHVDELASLPLFIEREATTPSVFQPIVIVPTMSPEPEVIDTSALESSLLAAISDATDHGYLRVSDHADTLDAPSEIPPSETTLGAEMHTHSAQLLSDPITQVSDCVAPDWVDLGGWAVDVNFTAALARQRANLVAANGQISGEAVTALARTYVAHGFGTEAIAALELDAISSRERDVLIEIAHLIEGSREEYPILSHQTGCAGFAGLLAYIASDPPPSLSRSEIYDMVATAGQWPAAQHHPRLMASLWAQFEAQGFDAATHLLPGTPQADSSPQWRSPEQVHELLDVAQDLNPQQAQEVIDLADSYAFEARDTDAADPILMSQLEALLDLHHYRDAQDLIRQARGTPSGDRAAEERFLARAAAESADDAFLEIAFSWSPYGHDAATRRQISARLETLGFADQAALWHPDGAAYAPMLALPSPPEPPAEVPVQIRLAPPTPIETGRSALASAEALRGDLTQLLGQN